MPTKIKKYNTNQILLITAITLGAVLLGAFVVVGELRAFVSMLVDAVLSRVIGLSQGIRITPMMLIAIGGIVAAGALYEGWRRYTLNVYTRHTGICPRCNKAVHQAHRLRWDRALNGILRGHLLRYRCPDCGWTGLQRQRKHRKEPRTHRSKAGSAKPG
jgi:hypothetical protein